MDEEPELSSAESIGAEDEAILTAFLERHGLKPRESAPAEAEDAPTRQQKKKTRRIRR